ncbi:hypothetical protein ACFL9S_10915 [Erwinia sp. AnSW2-5]|uniref:hypothetical protein n=1 Tax=Erwinia sp. AnSW2-5 TaxID=3367692 RepID=UPI00385AAB23
MTEIKRYQEYSYGVEETAIGEFVKFDDHAAIVAALQENLSRYSMSPGWADQRQNESKYVREVLGFGADADDVSPKDLVDAITALQEQVRALAAENVAQKLALEPQEVPDELQDLLNDTAKLDIDSEGGLDSDSASGQSWGWVENSADVIRAVLAAIKPETPATDAAIRGIRADGAAACGTHLREWYDYQVEERAEEFSERIRAGEVL